MATIGVDVSIYQGDIDWYKVAEGSSVKFAYAKCTEGTQYFDPFYNRNHDGAKAHGLSFGGYHYLDGNYDADEQAEWFLTSSNGRLGNLLPMLDVEEPGISVDKITQFTKIVEGQIGTKMIIYTSAYYWNDVLNGSDAFSGHPLWVANYTDAQQPYLPTGWSTYKLWQFSSSGSVTGIKGPVDLDTILGSLQDIALPAPKG
jgi:lysozyme